MICPKCKAIVPDDSLCCQVCGRDMGKAADSSKARQIGDPFSSLGDLCDDDQDDNADSYVGEVAPPEKVYKKDTLFCTACGRPTPADAVFCEHCGKQLAPKPKPNPFQWKKWMTAVACCAAVLLLIFVIPLGEVEKYPPDAGNEYVEPLCDTCDYVLCRGTDVSGNTYELVANQTETSQGFEITVGIIENNEWLVPLTSEFPFLGEDGLFHVKQDYSSAGSSLNDVGSIISNIYFIETGGFLMDVFIDSTTLFGNNEEYFYLYSCHEKDCISFDQNEYSLRYARMDASFSNGVVDYYGEIYTDNGKILVYRETSGTVSGWIEDRVYDWMTLDTRTLEMNTFGSNVAGLCPEGVLSEGLIFASDQCFYNTNMQKVIDLSAYQIDMWYGYQIYFKNGVCTFTAENDLGTEFEITIDKSGNVLSEVKK